MRLFVSGPPEAVDADGDAADVRAPRRPLVMIDLAVAATGGGGANDGGGDPLALVTFPGAYDLILSFLFGLGGLFAVIYGAAIAGSEWTWGTLKTAVVRGESRSRYLLSTFVAIAVVLAIGLLVAFAIGVVAAALGSTIAGIPLDGIGDTTVLERFAGALRSRLGRDHGDRRPRVRCRDAGPQPARRHRRRHRVLLRRDVRRDLPARRRALRAVPPVAGGGRRRRGFGGVPDPAALSTNVALVARHGLAARIACVAAGFSERAEITG